MTASAKPWMTTEQRRAVIYAVGGAEKIETKLDHYHLERACPEQRGLLPLSKSLSKSNRV
jgi:hypothetical protein